MGLSLKITLPFLNIAVWACTNEVGYNDVGCNDEKVVEESYVEISKEESTGGNGPERPRRALEYRS